MSGRNLTPRREDAKEKTKKAVLDPFCLAAAPIEPAAKCFSPICCKRRVRTRPLGRNAIMQKIQSDSLTKVFVLQPLTKVLPTVSPIGDLLASTNALEHENRIYWTLYLGILAILVAAVVIGFAGYIGAF
jgi:hypothetical protein